MSNVVELEQYKQHIAAEAFATEKADDVLAMLDNIKPYAVRSLMALIQASHKIVYYRGDLEPGESSAPEIVMPAQLQRAAKFQRYQVAPLGRIVRLTFCGNYFYDLYIEDFIDDDFLEEIIQVVQVECRANYLQSVADQKGVSLALDKMLDKESEIQS
jgi:hypothetical protein